jgi:Predicted hydrolase (metallo-beta-lactamase superfamily)
MPKITFYPVGNGDTCLIDLNCGKKMLFDYAQYYQDDNDENHCIDLATELRNNLESDERTDFDVVAFTHADEDHICGASDFFYLEHAKKYQSDDRIKIEELWVPAAFIIEQNLSGDAYVIRAEARHRLKEGKGVRVFSRPDVLVDWFETEGIKLEDRKHLITDAGNLVPGLTASANEVEFFVHSPFAKHVDDTVIDRNSSALIFHVTFFVGKEKTKFLLIGDSEHEVLSEIVNITKNHKRQDRLEWDIYDIPHHCSYLALNSVKGEEKTEPVENVKWLLEQGNKGGILVSCSNVVPTKGSDVQPPHRQAANYYKEIASNIQGTFVVTMEHPKVSKPEPIIITIDESGATLKKTISFGSAIITNRPAPRAGG